MKHLKRSLSLLLSVIMVISLLPTISAAAAETLELQYDDYYTFENAESVSVPEGTTAIEVDGTTIHAKEITDNPVNVTVDSQEYSLTVSKAKVNIVLVDGQSNAMGTAGSLAGVNPITPDKGTGYMWDTTTSKLTDLKTKVDERVAGSNSSVGFYPALAAEWYALTGEKTIIIHQYKSGRAIQLWDEDEYTRIANVVKSCISYVSANDNYEICHASYYWLQGESNSARNIANNGSVNEYANPNEYEALYQPIHNAYIDALETAGVGAMGGIMAVRSMSTLDSKYRNEICDYDGPRAAQQNLANQNADLIMASVLTNGWKEYDSDPYTYTSLAETTVNVDHVADMFYQGNRAHYNQSGYNVLGLDAADNMFRAVVQDANATGFDLYGNNGVTVYNNGDRILLSDISRAAYTWEVCNPEDASAAQVVVCPTPSYGKCAEAEMTLIDATGADISGIIGNNGYIPDTTQITYPLTLAVTAAGVTKTFTVTDNDFVLPENDGKNYYWDFTDTSKKDGDTFAAQTSNYWKANTLTYSTGSNAEPTTGLNISANGYTGSSSKYLKMAKPVTLKRQGKWTVEFKMNPTNYGTILGTDYNAATTKSLFYYPNLAPQSVDGTTTLPTSNYIVFGNGNMASNNSIVMDVKGLDIPNGVFYLTNDGTGKLTMAFVKDGDVVRSAEGEIKSNVGDYVFEGVAGIFKGQNFNFVGTMQYMKVYEEYTQFGNTAVTVTPPGAGETAQTTVSGDGYTGYVTWSPDLENGAFGEHTTYRERIVLAANADYNFLNGISSFSVNGETVTPSSVTQDMAILNVTFPETGKITTPYDDFYWDFTTATPSGKVVPSVIDETFASNPLTYQGAADPTISSSNGWTNDGSGSNFFTMAPPAILPKNAKWTIETEYTANRYGTILGTNSSSNSTWCLFHYPNFSSAGNSSLDGNYIFFSNATSVRPDQHYNVDINSINFNTAKKLYVTNGGTGKPTMCVTDTDGTVLTSAVSTQSSDAEFNDLGGLFAKRYFPLKGNMRYLKISREATIFDTIDVTVPAPIYGVEPVTEIAGNGYTATVTWSPAVGETFAADTAYTATVSLTADGAKFFDSCDFTINGENAETTERTDSAATLAPVAFPATGDTLQGYYWNFTDTSKKDGRKFYSETGNSWAANMLTNNEDFSVDSTNGYSGSASQNDPKYFTTQTPIILKKDQAWTIEWQGKQNSSLVLSNNDGQYNEYICYSNASQRIPSMALSPKGNMSTNYYARMHSFDESIMNNANTVWYVSNDGSGTITIAFKNGDQYQKTVAVNAQNKDFSFNTVMGKWSNGMPMSYSGYMKYMKVYYTAVELPEFEAKIVNPANSKDAKDARYYTAINDAIADCPTETYDDNAATTLSPTTVELLKDAEGGFDVGVEANKYDTQNILLKLNGHKLTLGHPGVASGSEDDKGIRVLAHSKLVVENGQLDVTAANVTRGMNVYGECKLDDVEFIVPNSGMDYTVRNRGLLTLAGETVIPNCGDAPALVVEPYEYGRIYADEPITFDVDAKVVCDSADVTVGDIEVKLDEMVHYSTGEVNNGVPDLDISAGTFGTITETGDSKEPKQLRI